jgi:hypothetical protein
VHCLHRYLAALPPEGGLDTEESASLHEQFGFPRRWCDPRVTPHQDVAFSTRRWVSPPESLTIRRSRSSPEGDGCSRRRLATREVACSVSLVPHCAGTEVPDAAEITASSQSRGSRGNSATPGRDPRHFSVRPAPLSEALSVPPGPFEDPSEAGVTVRHLGRATGEPAAGRPRGLCPGRALAQVGAAKARRVASRRPPPVP